MDIFKFLFFIKLRKETPKSDVFIVTISTFFAYICLSELPDFLLLSSGMFLDKFGTLYINLIIYDFIAVTILHWVNVDVQFSYTPIQEFV